MRFSYADQSAVLPQQPCSARPTRISPLRTTEPVCAESAARPDDCIPQCGAVEAGFWFGDNSLTGSDVVLATSAHAAHRQLVLERDLEVTGLI
jgi:hypothetical protein